MLDNLTILTYADERAEEIVNTYKSIAKKTGDPYYQKRVTEAQEKYNEIHSMWWKAVNTL